MASTFDLNIDFICLEQKGFYFGEVSFRAGLPERRDHYNLWGYEEEMGRGRWDKGVEADRMVVVREQAL